MAWSYSIILGSACGIQEPIKTLFLTIMQRVNIRCVVQAEGVNTYRMRIETGTLAAMRRADLAM